MFRVHQFDKVEMFVVHAPGGLAGGARAAARASRRSSSRSSGSRTASSTSPRATSARRRAKKYDIEAWFPGQERYREITSTSNTTDYQARRLDIRFRREGKLEFVHTLNGTAVTARAMLAILGRTSRRRAARSRSRTCHGIRCPEL